ncbi:winged helix-turn-helix domain-containing protein [Methanolobus zinderi]|uniref:Winged helix-turn-helix domain-containing protein n=1 Tax=Methanolobus zinderi TaxID=536044 RepID=A0A7D5EE48_9EURY|nr:winged helix-turn-helix domain-containing protein [Methanolobus zinderi]QLC49896.1 winged helix-turn-helix domain-containing protein [Methanolobus zinderi]
MVNILRKKLLDVMFSSEKRKNVLLFLKDGSRGMEEILRHLETTRQALLPQMRILEDHHLITDSDDTYSLTVLGELVVDKASPLLKTVDLLDVDIDYWGTRNLEFLPPALLEGLNGISVCRVITPPLTDLYEVHKDFHNESKNPGATYAVTAFLYPNYNQIFTELLASGVEVNFIVSKELFEKIRANHRENFQRLLENESFRMYVYNKDMDFLFFTYDDFHILINLLKKDGTFDNKHVLCDSMDSLEWGSEFFEYCRENSTPVTEI